MGKIKGKNTKLEQSVSKAVWRKGFRYRKNVLSLFGKPDIAIKKYRIALFIDSCFWHGCSKHFKIPAKNQDYWAKKINRNIDRDIEVTRYYQAKNWFLIRIWEHELKFDFDSKIEQICETIVKAQLQKDGVTPNEEDA
ncbi:very short patch repair endonuclease [Paenibacillus methanolicus]|uniref:very short patch repair endonuclease n=1 Tax=Paenibacillus methanolicus TaxID=582686 RepID=UPI0011E69965|nr:very short patch repair endonuclease [Paenibacillus methanolicus]